MMAAIFIAVILMYNILICVWSQKVEVYNFYDEYLKDILASNNDIYTYNEESSNGDKVEVKLFYETLCPDCIRFDTRQFKEAIYKFGDLIKINTYPYGNAKTKIAKDKVYFICQHGPAECYGNKLHACALDNIENQTEALLFNTCMMDDSQNKPGSDDEAADQCANNMNLDSEPIKKCAKGIRGTQLLQYYGEESKKINFQYVPYILVNSKETEENTFIQDICNAFTNPPPPCRGIV